MQEMKNKLHKFQFSEHQRYKQISLSYKYTHQNIAKTREGVCSLLTKTEAIASIERIYYQQ